MTTPTATIRTVALFTAFVFPLTAAAFLLGDRGSGSGGGQAAAAVVATAQPQSDRAREGVLVAGTGYVTGRPDTLHLEIGVQNRGETVAEAMRRANRSLDRVRDALREGGVEGRDLQSSGLSIEPEYTDDGSRVDGYLVNERLSVSLRDLDKAGALIGRAAAAAGNATRIDGLCFDIEQDSALLDQARQAAFAAARKKAELYAQAAGRTLGRIVSVTESVAGIPYGGGDYEDYSTYYATVPLERGSQRLAVTVTVEWVFS